MRSSTRNQKQLKIKVKVEVCATDVCKENIESNSALVEQHFVIVREGSLDLKNLNPAILKCTGDNLYVNDSSLTINQQRVLQHNDLIELKTFEKLFRFMDSRNHDYGEEISNELKLQYYVEKELGCGCNGKVRLAHDIWTLEKFAIKTVDLEEDEVDSLGNEVNKRAEANREIKIMRMANHQNILKLMNVIESPELVHLVLEFMDQGDLLKLVKNSKLKRFPEGETKFAMTQVVRGLQHLHGLNISHLDVKLDNILVQIKRGENIYKIGDFGFSETSDEVDSECGTPNYYPPEIFVTKVTKHSGKKRDMWSLGIVIFVTLSGFFPFDKAYGKLSNQVMKADLQFCGLIWGAISDNAKNMIKSLCVVEPAKRLSCDEVLKHPWLNEDKLKERLRNFERVLSPKVRAEGEVAPDNAKKRRVR